MTAWPARGDKVYPSDSYFGQVTIMPVMPPAVLGETGQASRPVTGSIVPARLFDKGWLNMS